MLKRTVSPSTYNLPMLWLDPHLYDKVLFMHTPFPLPKGVISGAEGEGVSFLVWNRSALQNWSLAELATSSLEGLDIFYAHIT